MDTFTHPAHTMLVIGALFLTGCATAPTLDFVIPADKIAEFNKCLGPQESSEKDNWRNGLKKLVRKGFSERDPFTRLDSLADFLPEVLKLSHAGEAKPEDAGSLKIPFDGFISNLPFVDSKLEDIVEALLHSNNLSGLLQPESDAAADSEPSAMSKPERIGTALRTYLMAYFTIWPEQKEDSCSETKRKSCPDSENGSPCGQKRAGTSGFISRDGTRFQFPVKIPNDLWDSGAQSPVGTDRVHIPAISSVDHSQVGADLIRIILEAIRDGFLARDDCAALPAISESATGVTAGLLMDFHVNACKTYWKVDLDDFIEIQMRANAAEAMIARTAGKAIRGGSMGSLNNEALARAVETAAGVIARHTTERVEWCKARIKNDNQ